MIVKRNRFLLPFTNENKNKLKEFKSSLLRKVSSIFHYLPIVLRCAIKYERKHIEVRRNTQNKSKCV